MDRYATIRLAARAGRKRTAFVVEIDSAELTMRIAEAACDITRPPGRSAELCLAELRASDPATAAGFDRIARAAAGYITECIKAGREPS